jgi:hypothetical protein
VFQNIVLRITFRTKKKEETEGWRKFHEELCKMYSSPNIIRIIKPKRMRWAGLIAHVGDIRINNNKIKLY